MIKVNYISRLGNNLFQYCLGRILAEELGYELVVKPIKGFPNTQTKIYGKSYTNDPLILEGQIVDLKKLLNDNPKRMIVLNGWFQNYDYYIKYKSKIRNWLKTDGLNSSVGKRDLVIGIRRGDYNLIGALLPFSYYKGIADLYDKIWVCTDDPNDPFIKRFCKRTNAKLYHYDTLTDFNFIKNFNNICLSQSTFHWWAAYLSNAEKIYFPIPKTGFWSKKQPEINLEVNEKRYIKVVVEKNYKPTLKEKFYNRQTLFFRGRIYLYIKERIDYRIIKFMKNCHNKLIKKL